MGQVMRGVAGGGVRAHAFWTRCVVGLCCMASMMSHTARGQQSPASPSPAIPSTVMSVTPSGIVTLFTGITPSAAQQQQLDAIKQKYAGLYKTFVVTTNARLKATHQRPGAFERAAADSLRQANFAEIRRVLTPAQQTQFNANLVAMATVGDSARHAMMARGAVQASTLQRPTSPTAGSMSGFGPVLAPTRANVVPIEKGVR